MGYHKRTRLRSERGARAAMGGFPVPPAREAPLTPGATAGPWTLRIDGWRPALLNELLKLHPMRAHRRKKADADVLAAAGLLYDVPKATAPRRVGLTICGRYSTFPDPDSPWKSLLDGLKRAGLIVDDGASWCRCDQPIFLRGPRYTLIELEDLTPGGGA
jgi:hypothetical protein